MSIKRSGAGAHTGAVTHQRGRINKPTRQMVVICPALPPLHHTCLFQAQLKLAVFIISYVVPLPPVCSHMSISFLSVCCSVCLSFNSAHPAYTNPIMGASVCQQPRAERDNQFDLVSLPSYRSVIPKLILTSS